MIRRCVLKLLLVLLIMIEKRWQNNYRCRDNDAEIRMPGAEGRRNVKCPKFRVGRATPLRAIVFGGQGTARPTYAAWRCRAGCVNRLGVLGARRDEHRYTDWGARARPRALPRKIGLTALCDR